MTKDELLQFRIDNKLTQKQLGKMLGISESQISFMESGYRQMTIRVQKKLDRLINTTSDLYFDGDKIDRLFNVIRFLFATPDNIDKINKIFLRNPLPPSIIRERILTHPTRG